MNRQEFFSHLNHTAPTLHSVAASLTKNQETAQLLYLETIHQALNNLSGLSKHSGFRAWIVMTMRNVFLGNTGYLA